MALFRSNISFLKCSFSHFTATRGIQSSACRVLRHGKPRILQPALIQDVQIRSKGSALTNYSGRELWYSVYGVSPTGRKRGRARMLIQAARMDLNFGKKLGDGKAGLLFPGLNENVTSQDMDGKLSPNTIKKRPEGAEQLITTKSSKPPRLKPFRAPLDRGWTSTTLQGTKMKPLTSHEQNIDNFISYVVETKIVSRMTATLGNKRTSTAVVIVGNKNGLVGMGTGRSLSIRSAMLSAQKRAYNRLVEVPLFEDHTVYHNMYSQFHKTRLFIYKKSKGYGNVAHRVIRCICEAAGIKDIYVKAEGAKHNNLLVARAFLNAIANQENHQQLSNRLNLHVLEYRQENNYQPIIVASPEGQAGIATGEQLANDEEDIYNDFNRYYFRGKLKYTREMMPIVKKNKMQNWNRGRKKKYKELYMLRNQDRALQIRKANLWGNITYEKA